METENCFLDDKQIGLAIQNLTRKASSLDLAVSFWGEGAIENLNLLDGKRPIRILCNLLTGGTNPKVIGELLKNKGQIEVRHRSDFHGKVYISSEEAVVGSANASANGIGFQEKEVAGWYEAGFLVGEEEHLEDINNWFERVWAVSSRVTQRDLEEAEKVWERRRRKRPKQIRDKLFIDLLKDNPEELEDRLVFAVYLDEGSSEEAAHLYYSTKEEVREFDPDLADELSFYEHWPDLADKKDDLIVVDIPFGPRGKWKGFGFYKIVPQLSVRKADNGSELLFCVELPDEYETSYEKEKKIIEPVKEQIWEKAYPDCNRPFTYPDENENGGLLGAKELSNILFGGK